MGEKIQSGGITIEQQSSEELLLVDGYGGGGFRLMGRRFEGGIILLPSGVYPINATSLDLLEEADFERAFHADEKPELILIGTGSSMQLLPKKIKDHLSENSLGFDIMDTGAAARTYNVLMMENRRVAALLLPVE
ncbi:Mth938-like domain-containing protein [Kordiimonas sp. SCSIO 12610]|uniref:Mth938-like domain-containing protein n=1 Tax=Kordiimonas sp. SCSIO 12610 TaxID=2829597 RepID=UPI00210EBC62|nr:Mth938-like domain-containing protein [Kordiimonas sp. SCSIO 12610]UTW54223.1 Mth938-like domain-containing protein [Kordiimonas sp. SCSIO 12610]